jgi:hypothetical protein
LPLASRWLDVAASACGEDRRAGAGRLARVQPQGLLCVDAAGQRHGHLAQQVARGGEVVVLEAQQAGDAAAAQQRAVQRAHGAVLDDADGRAGGVHRVGGDLQLRCLVAEHEALAAGDEHAERAVVGRDGRELHVLAQLRDDPVALVQQVVGRVAAAQGRRDLLIQLRDACGELVGLRDRRLQVLRDAGLQRVEAAAGVGVASRDVGRARQHHLPRRCVLRAAGEVGHRVEELVGRVADARLAEREHAFQALQLLEAGAVHLGHGRGAGGFARQERVVRTGDGVDVDALAEEAGACELAGGGGQLHLLARVAVDVRVGDVVAGGLQRRVVREHRARADGHEGRGHLVSCPLGSYSPSLQPGPLASSRPGGGEAASRGAAAPTPACGRGLG